MIINPLIYSGMDHFWLKQPRESIEFRSRFFTRNYLTVWIQWIFVVTLHHPKTWNKNLIKLVRSGRSSEYIFSSVLRLVISFFFHSPSPMIWSCFFLLFIFSTIYHFSFSTFRWVKSLLHRNFILLMFQSWKLFFMRQHSRISIFILPCFPLPPTHSQTLIYHHPFKARTFFAQGMSNSCIGFSFENKKKLFDSVKKALETRDIQRNALVLVSAI